MIPDAFHVVAIASVVLAGLSALVIVAELLRHPQHMWIMNVVWPVTALFGSILAIWSYFRYRRLAEHAKTEAAMRRGEEMPHQALVPFSAKAGKGPSHRGSGCTLGDICAKWLAFLVPAVAVWFGWRWLFPEKTFAVWVVDYLFPFAFGVAFGYFTIKPMRELSVGEGLKEAIKADVLSLTAWQVGMYGFMALAHFYIFKYLLGAQLHVDSAEFWFMMQIAMLAGFATSYPVNWWLIRRGIKEAM